MIKLREIFIILCFIFIASSCATTNKDKAMITKSLFGTLSDGREVHLFTLKNTKGVEVGITNFGATVTSIIVPDKSGKMEDVVLGYDSLEGFVNDKSYLGVIVGRYGNRIGKGKFSIDGKNFQVTVNDGENHLHGGALGFHKVLWEAKAIESDSAPAVQLTYVSKDGEDGYPGTVTIKVTYTLTSGNELKMDYEGTTDKPTILNPTNHAYFNLTGNPTNTILEHQLQIDADSTTPVVKGLITTGEFASVTNTPFDFRTATAIGARINDNNEQLKLAGGYDHNWVLKNYDGKVRKVGELYEPKSGRLLIYYTDQPGLQFYSGNFLDGSIKGKKGISYQYRTGLCLEAQHYPDSPNKPQWPSVVLRPGETYKQTTVYKFSTK